MQKEKCRLDSLLEKQDAVWDCAGDMQMIRGYRELMQRAMIRLRMKQGSFAYMPELGSTLHRLDMHKLDSFTLLSVVREALKDLEGIVVIDVERTVDYNQKILYLTVYLQINEEQVVMELKNELWNV